MTSKRTDLEVNVVARADQAKRELGQVADDAEQLEQVDPEVTVGVDDNASDPLADIRAKLDGLNDRDREIAIRANIDQLERQVRNAERALGRLDRFDQKEIGVRIEARDNATRKIEALQTELRSLDGETVDVKVESRGADDIRGVFNDLTGSGAVGGIAAAGAGAGGAGLIGAAAAGSFVLAQQFANAALQAQAIADAFGSTPEDASRLLTVFAGAGYEFDDLFDLLAQFQQALNDTPELRDRLKIDPSASPLEQFITAADNLATEIDDVGERGVIASQLFGEEGVRQVALIKTTVGDLGDAVDNVPSIALVDPADVERARNYKTEIQQIKAYADAIAFAYGGTAARQINDLVEAPGGLLERLDFIRRGLFGSVNPEPPTVTGAVPLDREALARLGVYATSRNPGTGSRRGGDTIIINPPGTPTATIEQQRLYNARNGNRS